MVSFSLALMCLMSVVIFPGTFIFADEVDNDRPCILFGYINMTGGSPLNHAVTAYGYYTRDTGGYAILCNFGWGGYSTVVVDGQIYAGTTHFNPNAWALESF